jgi:plasmid maintenance system antidote protein VapI
MNGLLLLDQTCALCTHHAVPAVLLDGPCLTQAIALCNRCLATLQQFAQYTCVHIDLHHGQTQPTAADMLDTLRHERDFTKADFARAVGYTQSHVTRVLTAETSISTHFAYSVQEAFGLGALHLLHRQSADQLTVIAHTAASSRANPRKGNTVDVDEAQIEEDYRHHTPIHEIARSNDVSYGTVWRILDKRGVPVEPFGGPMPGRPAGAERGLRAHRSPP